MEGLSPENRKVRGVVEVPAGLNLLFEIIPNHSPKSYKSLPFIRKPSPGNT